MPTVLELKAMAKAKGLKGYSKLNKMDMEKLLGLTRSPKRSRSAGRRRTPNKIEKLIHRYVDKTIEVAPLLKKPRVVEVLKEFKQSPTKSGATKIAYMLLGGTFSHKAMNNLIDAIYEEYN